VPTQQRKTIAILGTGMTSFFSRLPFPQLGHGMSKTRCRRAVPERDAWHSAFHFIAGLLLHFAKRALLD